MGSKYLYIYKAIDRLLLAAEELKSCFDSGSAGYNMCKNIYYEVSRFAPPQEECVALSEETEEVEEVERKETEEEIEENNRFTSKRTYYFKNYTIERADRIRELVGRYKMAQAVVLMCEQYEVRDLKKFVEYFSTLPRKRREFVPNYKRDVNIVCKYLLAKSSLNPSLRKSSYKNIAEELGLTLGAQRIGGIVYRFCCYACFYFRDNEIKFERGLLLG